MSNYVHKVGLNKNTKRFSPVYQVSTNDLMTGLYGAYILLNREFDYEEGKLPLEDKGYLEAKEVAFKLNAIYDDILDALNEAWELELFMSWLEGKSTAFDIYQDAYRDESLIKGDINGETGESTTGEGNTTETNTGTETGTSAEGEAT